MTYPKPFVYRAGEADSWVVGYWGGSPKWEYWGSWKAAVKFALSLYDGLPRAVRVQQ